MDVVVLIPSLNPDHMLLRVVENIRKEGFSRFLIVNDGSRADFLPVFGELERSGCTVIHHAVNLGKGRALKTGFNHIMKYMPDAAGVVTCDADGQHEPSAIRAIAATMLENPGNVVLGVRKFFEAKVPLPNLLGNTITRLVFYLLTGLSFGDTQCGLRAFPMGVLPHMMETAGERFEYENVMLLEFRKKKITYIEVPMRAVYETVEHGKLSHFNKLLDPIRIYRKLLGFAAVPIFCGILASVLFMLAAQGIKAEADVASLGLRCSASGMLWLWILAPARKAWMSALMLVLGSILTTTLIWVFSSLFRIPPVGAWWLAAVPVMPIAYSLWLTARYGKKPHRTKTD